MFRRQSICVFAGACALIMLVILAGCGGNASSPPATASAPPAAVPAPPTPPPPTPPAPPPTPAKATQFLYVDGPTGMTQTSFRVGSDGSLTSLGTALQTSNSTVLLAASEATGHHVFGFDSSKSNGPLLTFSVDANSGALHQTSSAALPANAAFASKPVLSPAGTFMFVGLEIPQSGFATFVIATYSVDSAGNLTLVPAADGSAGKSVPEIPALVVNPSGTFLYAALESHSVLTPINLIQFAIDSAGRLTQVSSISVPLSSDIGSTSVAMTPNGRTLYLHMLSPAVIAFAVDPSTGNLTENARVSCGCGNADEGGRMVVNAKGTLLFEGVGGESFDDGGVALFSIDQSTGALTPLSNSFVFVGSSGVPSFVVDSSGTFLYATGFLSNFKGVSVTDAGVVSSVPGSPFEQTEAQSLFMVNVKP